MNNREIEIGDALKAVEARITTAAASAGRSRSEITLIAVTKTYPVTDVEILRNLGVQNFGENRSEEGVAKSGQVSATWHFQGQVQSRKLRDIATWASFVHSLDSAEHVEKLSRVATESEKEIAIFLQLSLDGAVGRGGVIATDLKALADAVVNLPHIKLVGLMCVPPVEYEHERAFSVIAEIHQSFIASFPSATYLSAGMSSDFEVAISHGATHLRVGSQILGSRPYHP
ncbi:COG0325 Predicted enzyme with a TIM-barrel fold [Candidatus Nanopelagicaceae bacterium]